MEVVFKKSGAIEKKHFIQDKMYILPCLQERRAAPIRKGPINLEPEQEGSIITRKNGFKKLPKGTSDIFNNRWANKNTTFKEGLDIKAYNDERDSLYIPQINSFYGKNEGEELFTNCKKLSPENKWDIYFRFLHDRSRDKESTALFITHHNRLRGLKKSLTKESGLLSLNRDARCNAYANNFCLKITVEPKSDYESEPNIKYEIIYSGFPDKGELSNTESEENSLETISPKAAELLGLKPKSSDSLEPKAARLLGLNGGDYTYCSGVDSLSDINLKNISNGIISAHKNGYITQKRTLFIIRHGNALHNKPLKVKDDNRLDSSLSPLGLYQAHILGQVLASEQSECFFNDVNIQLCTSFLSRTQLTGLSILKSIYGKLPNVLDHDYKLLLQNSINKFKDSYSKKYGNKQYFDIFNGYPPVDFREMDNFNTFVKEKEKFVEYLNNPRKFRFGGTLKKKKGNRQRVYMKTAKKHLNSKIVTLI
tara:strand:- start:17175 stop:18614 length:1440 start_codon:yes stop_codon:yes gene_type:complete